MNRADQVLQRWRERCERYTSDPHLFGSMFVAGVLDAYDLGRHARSPSELQAKLSVKVCIPGLVGADFFLGRSAATRLLAEEIDAVLAEPESEVSK